MTFRLYTIQGLPAADLTVTLSFPQTRIIAASGPLHMPLLMTEIEFSNPFYVRLFIQASSQKRVLREVLSGHLI
jgi:hypothetical protein